MPSDAELTTGPRPGELWTVGSYTNLKFIGIAYDFAIIKFFVFEDPTINGMFVIKKDDFFDHTLQRHKQ